MTRAWGDVELTPNDRFNAGAFSLEVELNGSVHITVIGHRYRRLPERGRPIDYLFKLISPIKKTVLRMEMEMTELRHCGLARKVKNMTERRSGARRKAPKVQLLAATPHSSRFSKSYPLTGNPSSISSRPTSLSNGGEKPHR
jgi:hypothetical protein